MIKKYYQFILEKVNQSQFDINFQKIDSHQRVEVFTPELKHEKEYMEKLRNEFAKKIEGLSEYFDSHFSNLASSGGNPEEDFNEMQRIIDKTGFTLDIIKKLFSKKVCQSTSEYYPYFIHKNHLDTINGYIDVYLFMLNEKLDISEMTGVKHNIDLGGQGFDKSMGANEWIVKYAYGYHKTPYGKLFIKQLELTPEQFIETTFTYMKEYFIEEMNTNLSYELSHKIYFDWGKYLQSDDDGFIIYYSDIVNDIDKLESLKTLKSFCSDILYDKGNRMSLEELLKKLILECFNQIKDVIKIHDSGDYFHFHE